MNTPFILFRCYGICLSINEIRDSINLQVLSRVDLVLKRSINMGGYTVARNVYGNATFHDSMSDISLCKIKPAPSFVISFPDLVQLTLLSRFPPLCLF